MSTSDSGFAVPGPRPLPVPRAPVSVRPATPDDLPFIDALQKRHARAVGWMPRAQLEQKVAAGQVLVAEAGTDCGSRVSDCGMNSGGTGTSLDTGTVPAFHSAIRNPRSAIPIGYLISSDRYFKRDDVGVVYQMNVAPGAQRGLVGATLLKAAFDRAAYGCKLFCCWCAQDLEANHFWSAMGFVPLAFRAGGEKRKPVGSAGRRTNGGTRVHIFWQRRIRAGDASTPFWFPAKTDAGAMREDRLVLPIPPGHHWSDEMPVLLPQESIVGGPSSVADDAGGAGGERGRKKLPAGPTPRGTGKGPALPPRARAQFGPPPADAGRPAEPASPAPTTLVRATPSPRPKRKIDPRLVAAARELRDRWLERANADPFATPAGKYDVSRSIAGTASAASDRSPAVTGSARRTTRGLPAPLAA